MFIVCTSGCVCRGVFSVCVFCVHQFVFAWVSCQFVFCVCVGDSCQCVCCVYIRLCLCGCFVSVCVLCASGFVCMVVMSVCVHQVVFVWVSCQCVFQASVSKDLGGAVEGMKPTEWSHTSNWTSNADL